MSNLITKEEIRRCRKKILSFKVSIDKRLMGGNSGGKTSTIAKSYLLKEEQREDVEKLVGRLE